MNFTTFHTSLLQSEPPAALSLALTGLWWDGKGRWADAHQAAQQDDGPDGAWVHAYLHRKEGDASNAAYWYRRAGRPIASGPLQSEWNRIAHTLLAEAAAGQHA